MTKKSLTPEPGYPHQYAVQSETDPELEHIVHVLNSSGESVCDCKGFNMCHKCAHIDIVMQMEQEDKAAQEAADIQAANVASVF